MTEDMHGWLRVGLAHVAAKAVVPDLAHAARRQSHRTTVRRVAVAAAAALVLLVTAAGATWKLLPDHNGVPPADPDPRPTTSAPAVEPTEEPTATGSSTPSASAPVAGAAKLTGTAYYLSVDQTTSTTSIVTFHNGSRHTVLTMPSSAEGCVARSIVVSPDGRQVAWVTDDAGGDTYLVGDLSVANIDGTGKHVIRTGVGCLGNLLPMWTANSRGLRFQPFADRAAAPTKEINVATRVETASPDTASMSPDGLLYATKQTNGVVTITDRTGKTVATTNYQPANDKAHGAFVNGWAVRGISTGGRYMSVGWRPTDPTRQVGCSFIVDTATSREIGLPGVGHDELRSALFLTNGSMIIEADTSAGTVMMLLSADRVLLDQRTEPTVLGNLLAYVG